MLIDAATLKAVVLMFFLSSPCQLDATVGTLVANSNAEACVGSVLLFPDMDTANKAIDLWALNRQPLDVLILDSLSGNRRRVTIKVVRDEASSAQFPATIPPPVVQPMEEQP